MYKDMAVDIIAELNAGQVKWTIRTIDRETGELPEDVFAGFLPPEDGQGSGQGYVTFSMKSKNSLTAGTKITNKASIVFDTNAAIVTKEVFNTITHAGPAASAEPSTADGATDVSVFTVLSWGASDYATGYDLYLWKQGESKPVTPTAADLTGTFYEPLHLEYGTVYKWQIVAKNIMGSSQGPEWTFTTETYPYLSDCIRVLQTLTGTDAGDLSQIPDVGNDGKKGLPEAILLLQYAAEMR